MPLVRKRFRTQSRPIHMVRLASKQARSWFYVGDYPPTAGNHDFKQRGVTQNGDTRLASSKRPSSCQRRALNPCNKDGALRAISVGGF
jgi:hypothetical protein